METKEIVLPQGWEVDKINQLKRDKQKILNAKIADKQKAQITK